MRILLFTAVLLTVGVTTKAQFDDAVTQEIDELLFDSKFHEVIQKINTYTSADIDTDIVLNTKKTEALIRLGNYDEARALLQALSGKTSQSKNQAWLKAIIQSNIGFLYLNQGRYDLALQALTESTNTLQQDGAGLPLAQSLSYLGQVYISTGKYAQAEEQLLKALRVRQEKLAGTHELIAASYNDLGLVYSQLDPDKAFEYYEMASALYEKLHGKEHPKLAIANTNLGVLHLSEKLFGDAINYFETALKIWEKIYTVPHPNKAMVLMNLGQTYSGMGNQKTALDYYEKAVTLYEASVGTKHPDVAYVYNLIGNVQVAEEKFDAALNSYQRGLMANVSDFNNTDVSHNPSCKNFYNGNVLLYSMMYKAQALEARHFGKTLKQRELDLGLATLQACDSLIDRLRQQATNESDKIALGAIANEVYADGVRIAYTLSEIALKNRKTYRALSFYFAEKSKSAVLLDAISDTNAKAFAGIPDALLEEEKSLKTSITLVLQKLAQKPTADEEKQLRETAFTLNQHYQSFIQKLESHYPEYYNLKYNAALPSIHQLQALLPRQTALVSYFIDEKRARLYRYALSKRYFHVTETTLPKDYNRYITGLRNSLYYSESNSFLTASGKLSKLLLPKLPREIQDVIIVPTGRLSILPFETLLTRKVKAKSDFGNLPYLLKKYSVRYEFSAGLLLQKKNQDAPAKLTSALLCAPVHFPIARNLADLPGTEAEVNAIAQLLSQGNIAHQVLLNNNASEAALKTDALKNYSLIHLATHGMVDETNPELSRIFFQSDTETEDGDLFAGEIYNLQLNADLVSLSACETGMGKISKGEGVIGLSRALVYAGAKNIVVSFWSVADESTAALMTDFYKNMLENSSSSFSQNLRQAKLNLLSGQYSAPYYWAPFILIGY
jgi:CHAT domain-containing protein/uncharacterized protein HemY